MEKSNLVTGGGGMVESRTAVKTTQTGKEQKACRKGDYGRKKKIGV